MAVCLSTRFSADCYTEQASMECKMIQFGKENHHTITMVGKGGEREREREREQ